MEYRRIDENTIRCIITQEDMENFGLDLDEFLSHSQKSDEVLRRIVEEAREELGYTAQHGVVSMRLEVLSDNRISLTFAGSDNRKMYQQMMKHIEALFPDVDAHVMERIVDQLSKMPENKRIERISKFVEDALNHTIEDLQSFIEQQSELANQVSDKEPKEEQKKQYYDTYRLYSFNSIRSTIDFCKAIGLKQPIKSHLFKENNTYYLLVERYRISEYNFNLITSVAFEYATLYVKAEDLKRHLWEHGELLIENKAIGALRKL